MIRRTLEVWRVSESKRAGVPMTPSWMCRPCVAADADARTAVATQATETRTRTILKEPEPSYGKGRLRC